MSHTAILALIVALGAPKYADRQAAYHKLEGVGCTAYRELCVAEHDADPQIRESSTDLLAEIYDVPLDEYVGIYELSNDLRFVGDKDVAVVYYTNAKNQWCRYYHFKYDYAEVQTWALRLYLAGVIAKDGNRDRALRYAKECNGNLNKERDGYDFYDGWNDFIPVRFK